VDVADELGGGVDVAAGGDDGGDAAVGADHEIQYRVLRGRRGASRGPARTARGFAWRGGDLGG
jgi:hypothetical protein